MKRIFINLISITFATLLTGAPLAAWEVKAMNDTISSANFIVNSGCSGTLISKEHGLILTNHHCLRGGIKVVSKKVTGKDGKISSIQVEELVDLDVSQRAYIGHQLVGEATYKAEIIARWKESDLALLKTRSALPNSIEAKVFPGKEVIRGETVYVVGNPAGLGATVTKGIISSTTRMFRAPWADNAEVSFLQIDAGMTGGNSGGSLFNNVGELIGVPAAGVRGNGHLGFAIPFFRVQEFLTNNCWGGIWNENAETRKDCQQRLEGEAKGDK